MLNSSHVNYLHFRIVIVGKVTLKSQNVSVTHYMIHANPNVHSPLIH